MNITVEQGKTLKGARTDVLCGLGTLCLWSLLPVF